MRKGRKRVGRKQGVGRTGRAQFYWVQSPVPSHEAQHRTLQFCAVHCGILSLDRGVGGGDKSSLLMRRQHWLPGTC